MSRWKAASIHLSISITVGLLTLALLFLVWFPQPYFEAAGGQHLIIVLLGVDLVLGPLLTLILFKSGKRGMVFDLWMIGIVQSTALVYGLFVISLARPAFIVGVVDRFNVVAVSDLEPADLAKGSAPEYRTLSWTGPRLVATRRAPVGEERNRMLESGLQGKDIQYFPEYYVPYAEEVTGLLEHAKPLEKLRERQPQSAALLDDWLKTHQRTDVEVVFLPILARKASLTMLLDARTGEILDALPVNPW